jgi:hypothetical protein
MLVNTTALLGYIAVCAHSDMLVVCAASLSSSQALATPAQTRDSTVNALIAPLRSFNISYDAYYQLISCDMVGSCTATVYSMLSQLQERRQSNGNAIGQRSRQ